MAGDDTDFIIQMKGGYLIISVHKQTISGPFY